MSFRYPQPNNEDDFELFCLRFLRELWCCPTLQLYGKRGERQFGIDIIDEAGGSPLRGVQSKHHEHDKTIPPAEIEEEVSKALGLSLPLGEYYILTTAKKSTQGQNAVIRINLDHQKTNRFKVFVWTWADIEERLSQLDDATQDKVLRGDSGRSGPAICRMLTQVVAEHLDRPLYSSASVFDLEFDAVKGLLDRHEIEIAEHKLIEIETRGVDKLQPHHWYQLKALRSRIYSNRWEWEKAGRELIDAKRFMPETERARINEAAGYEMIGEREKAHTLSDLLRSEYPHSVRLLTIWARTSPPGTSFSSIVEATTQYVNDHEDLNLTLAHRALVEDKFEAALEYGQRATEIDVNSPHAWFVLGQAKHALGYQPSSGPRKVLLREAEAHYDRAVPLAHTQKLFGLEAAIRLNRGKVRHVLGNQEADIDFATAIVLSKSDQDVQTQYVRYLLELDRFHDALRILTTNSSQPSTAHDFYEAAARYGRNIGEDRKRANELIHQVISAKPNDRWVEAHVFYVQWSIEDNNQNKARDTIIQNQLRDVNPLIFHTLHGWLANSQNDKESACTDFRNALNFLTDQTSRDQVFLLAQALASVDMDTQAIPLFFRCYRPGVFNLECRKLLGCAQRQSRHDVIVTGSR